MVSEPLVSIIIPVHNRAHLVEEAICSVLNQTYRAIELIVVDDGSIDQTPEVLSKYRGVAKVIVKDNGGVSSARNAGYDVSTGQLIAYLDSDDLWHPQKLQIFIDCFKKVGFQDAIMFSNFQRMNVGTRELLSHTQTEIFPFIFDYFKPTCPYIYTCIGADLLRCVLRGYPIYPSTVMLTRALHQSYRWNVEFRICEDFTFWLEAVNDVPFYYIHQALSTVRLHSSNISSDVLEMHVGDLRAIRHYLQHVSATAEQAKIARDALARRYWAVAYRYRKKGDLLGAAKHYLYGALFPQNIMRAANKLIGICQLPL